MTRTLWYRIAELWCAVMHPAPMWPCGGYYRCPKCLRKRPVPWEQEACVPVPQSSHARLAERPLPVATTVVRPAQSW